MTRALDFPTVKLEVAFNGGPGATPTWTDLTSRVRRIRLDRGRQTERDRFREGTITVLLDNRDRALEPENTASPYYPNVVPNRQLRLTLQGRTISAVVQFYGYVDKWPLAYSNPRDATVEVTATDAFKFLARAPLPDTVWGLEVQSRSPSFWYHMNDPTGSTVMADAGPTKTNGVYGTFAQPGQTAGPIAFSPYTALTCGPDADSTHIPATVTTPLGTTFSFAIWFLTTAAPGTDLTDRGFLRTANSDLEISMQMEGNPAYTSGPNLGDLTIWGIAGTPPINDGAWHMFSWAQNSTSALIYCDGVLLATVSSPAAFPSPVVWELGRATSVLLTSWTEVVGTDAVTGNPVNQTHTVQPPIPWLGDLAEFVIFPTKLSGADMAALYNAGVQPWEGDQSGARITRVLDLISGAGALSFPAGLRSIDTGNSTLQRTPLGGDALSYFRKVEESEGGANFVLKYGAFKFRQRQATLVSPYTVSQGTFTDDPASLLRYRDLDPGSDDQYVINHADVTRTGGQMQSSDDSTSQNANGYLGDSRTDQMYTSDNEAKDAADWRVLHYKDPKLRINRLDLDPLRNSGLAAQVIARELGDRITFVRFATSGNPITRDFHIEGIRQQIDMSASTWTASWTLSPAEPLTYWTLGTSALGTDTRLAY